MKTTLACFTSGAIELKSIDCSDFSATTIYKNNISQGWTNFVPFKNNGEQLALYFKYRHGAIAIDHFTESDGDISFKSKFSTEWNAQWSHQTIFDIGNQTVMLMYKEREGTAILEYINTTEDGEIETSEKGRFNWRCGWSNFLPFYFKDSNTPYMISYQRGSGDLSIDRYYIDYEPSYAGVHSSKINGAVTSMAVAYIQQEPHLLVYTLGYGAVTLYKLVRNKDNDKISLETVMERSWAGDWSNFQFFYDSDTLSADTTCYLLEYKVNSGVVAIDRIGNDYDTKEVFRTGKDNKWNFGYSHLLNMNVTQRPCFKEIKLINSETKNVYDIPAGDLCKATIVGDFKMLTPEGERCRWAFNLVDNYTQNIALHMIFQRNSYEEHGAIRCCDRVNGTWRSKGDDFIDFDCFEQLASSAFRVKATFKEDSVTITINALADDNTEGDNIVTFTDMPIAPLELSSIKKILLSGQWGDIENKNIAVNYTL